MMLRRVAAIAVVFVLMTSAVRYVAAQPSNGPPPVVFVHGMGTSAAEVGVEAPGGATHFGDLLEAIAARYPRPDVCQQDAQRGRPWDGSPCVFRYVEDVAEASEGGDAARGHNDSQSGVRENAAKLAREVAEVSRNAGDARVVLVGYSMGGAIIRTYLATHAEEVGRNVEAVVLIDAVASGSWGYAFAGEVPRRVPGSLGAQLSELMRTLAATAAAVDFTRPATRDLSPRSDLFREIAKANLPSNVSYYTFWGDIRIAIERNLLAYELPAFEMPSVGDLGLLPGVPDPATLPELGGQRFSPDVDDAEVALDVPHRTRIALPATVVSELLAACGHEPRAGATPCSTLVGRYFQVPNTHTAVPAAMARIMVDEPALGGRLSLLDAVLEAIGRHSDAVAQQPRVSDR